MGRATKEKKRHKKLRAALAGDAAALDSLAERNPSLAVEPCIQQLNLSPRSESAVAMARRVGSRLRKLGRHSEVARLVDAEGGSDPKLALEGALSAFALGNDAEAERLARLHPTSVWPIVEPLCNAASSKRTRITRDMNTTTRSLASLANVVACTRSGDQDAATRALRETDRAAPVSSAFAAASALSLLLFDASGKARRTKLSDHVTRLLASSPSGAKSMLVGTLAREAANAPLPVREQVGNVLLGEVERFTLSREARTAAQSLLVSALDLARESRPRVAGALAELGVEAFERPARGTARLYAAFGAIRRDPQRALSEFDLAVAEGADLVEALRGRFLTRAEEYAKAGGARLAGEYSATAERLLKTILHAANTSGHTRRAGLAVALDVCHRFALQAADLTHREQKLAEDWISRANELVKSSSRSERSALALHLLECKIHETDPARVLRAAESALAIDPASLPAWQAKLVACRRLHDPAWDDLVIQAWRATGAEEFAPEARRTLTQRGELEPYRDLAPNDPKALFLELAGQVTGLLTADEVERVFRSAAPHRAGLDAVNHAAFDAALLAALVPGDEVAAGRACALIAMHPDDAGASALRRSLSVLISAGASGVLERAIHELASRSDVVTSSLSELMGAFAVLDPAAARQMLFKLAPQLSRRVLSEVSNALVLGDREDWYHDAFEALHDLLHPEICLDELIEEGFPTDGIADECEDDEIAGIELLATLLAVPPALVERLSERDLDRLGTAAVAAMNDRTNEQAMFRLFDLAHGMGLPVGKGLGIGGFGTPVPSMRARSKSERNARKRQRKGRA